MATVMNAGDPGRGVDLSIMPKNANSAFKSNNENALIIVTGAARVDPLPRSPIRGDDECVRMYNNGTVAVQFRFAATATISASAADKSLPPGGIEVFRLTPNRRFISTFSASAGSLAINCGSGV